MNRTRRNLCIAAAALPASQLPWAADEPYPSKPIRIVVPLGPGSAFDAATRRFAEELARVAGQAVFVENKPGANTAIGVNTVLSAPADGHTLLALSNSMVSINQFVIKDLTYNPKDIRPVAGLLKNTGIFVTSATSKYKTWADVVTVLRRQPESISLGNYGQIYRFGSRHFEQVANLRFNHVPYQGAAQMITDLIGGSIDIALMEPGASLQLVRGGKMTPLALTGARRNPTLQEVPTLAELGWPGFTIEAYTAYSVSAKTPEPVVKKLEDMVLKAATAPGMLKWIEDRGSDSMAIDAQKLSDLIAREATVFEEIAKKLPPG